MSSLIVNVCEVEEISRHPNADRVELIRVGGWQCVSMIGQFKVGDKCVYFPPDTVIGEDWANKFNILKYCQKVDGGYRIRAQRFRGEKSFGFIAKPDNPNWAVGLSVIDHYGASKFEPPIRDCCGGLGKIPGDCAPMPPSFSLYYDIENIGNYPNIFEDGEGVVIDEKIHGTQSKVGIVRDREGEFVVVAGSRATNRREFAENGARSLYWLPMNENMHNLLRGLHGGDREVIVFGEIFGAGVQDLHYGEKEPTYRAFDIWVNGAYLSHFEKIDYFQKHDIPYANQLYVGPYFREVVERLTDGPTTLAPPDRLGKFKGREGVVIRPFIERTNPKLGRVILKSVSVDYLERKGGTEYH